jgi:DNA-binding NtrC family response regulator
MATPEISHPDSTPAAVVLPGSNGNGSSNGSGFLTMAELEKRHILAALTRCEGNRTHTAKMLKISIRTLRNKLHDFIGDAELAEDVE